MVSGRKTCAPALLSMMVAVKTLMIDVPWNRSESLHLFTQRQCIVVSISSSCSSPKREAVSTVKKNSAILKKAMTNRHTRWSKKEWYSTSNPHWRSSAGEDAGQDSHDKCKSSKPQDKWKEISLEMDVSGSAWKEKTHTWNKSCKESVKRESELCKMVDIAAIDERQEDKERSVLKDTLKKLQKERGRKRGSNTSRRNAAKLGRSAHQSF